MSHPVRILRVRASSILERKRRHECSTMAIPRPGWGRAQAVAATTAARWRREDLSDSANHGKRAQTSSEGLYRPVFSAQASTSRASHTSPVLRRLTGGGKSTCLVFHTLIVFASIPKRVAISAGPTRCPASARSSWSSSATSRRLGEALPKNADGRRHDTITTSPSETSYTDGMSLASRTVVLAP